MDVQSDKQTTPNSRLSKSSKASLLPNLKSDRQQNNRRIKNGKNNRISFGSDNPHGLSCCNTSGLLPSVTSPGVRRLTVFPEELMTPMANSINIFDNNNNAGIPSSNYNDVISSVIGANNTALNNFGNLNSRGNGVGSFMDFVVPQPQDPPFAAPTSFSWRSNNVANNIIMQMGRCPHHNHHQQNLTHHYNEMGMFSNSTHFPCSESPLTGSSIGGGGDNCNSPSRHFGNNACNARGSPFGHSSSNSTGYGSFISGDGMYSLAHKIYIPHHSSYNFIGRILGPRGNSVRRLEALTDCKILIRGKGSIKDTNQETRMRSTPGWEHLNEDLHVLITAEDVSEQICQIKLRRAALSVQRLLTPQFDEYKRQQLIQLAIINGTYRP